MAPRSKIISKFIPITKSTTMLNIYIDKKSSKDSKINKYKNLKNKIIDFSKNNK